MHLHSNDGIDLYIMIDLLLVVLDMGWAALSCYYPGLSRQDLNKMFGNVVNMNKNCVKNQDCKGLLIGQHIILPYAAFIGPRTI